MKFSYKEKTFTWCDKCRATVVLPHESYKCKENKLNNLILNPEKFFKSNK